MDVTLKKRFDKIDQWQATHATEDYLVHEENKTSFAKIDLRFDGMESNISVLPDERKIEEIVRKVLLEVLFTTGRTSKAIIITTAAILVALGIITGYFKSFLNSIGIPL